MTDRRETERGSFCMKIAVVTDSNSGITQAQAKEMGITVLPMPFMIDGETYYEDITLTQEQFYQKLKDNSDISTSQPTPDSIMKMWDGLLQEYDQIVHIPMSSGLCGQPPDFRDPVPVRKGRADVSGNGNGWSADQETSGGDCG